MARPDDTPLDLSGGKLSHKGDYAPTLEKQVAGDAVMPEAIGQAGSPEHPKRSQPGKLGEPNCPRCSSTDIQGKTRTLGGTEGVLAYCADCGAIVGWGPKIKNSC